MLTNGFPVVGNIETNSFILLTNEGSNLFDEIQKGRDIVDEKLSPNLKELIKVSLEEGILTLDEQVEENKKIVSVYLHITNRCNLHCVGCYSFDERRNKYEDLSLSKMKSIIDILHQHQIEKLLISGGEPFIRYDIVELLAYAKERIPQVVVGTNGTLITEKIAQSIKGIVDSVSLSIDGFSIEKSDYIRDKGTYTKVLRAAELLKEVGVPFSLLPTIHKYNYRDTSLFLELAQKIGAPIAFSLLTCNSYETDLKDFVLNEQEYLDFVNDNTGAENIHVSETVLNIEDLDYKTTCGAGKSTISIDSLGNVYPCHMMQSKEFCMGNVLKDSWESVFLSKIVLDVVESDVDKIEECSKCEFKYFCGGGCKARTYYAKGALNASDIYCDGLKEGYKKIFAIFSDPMNY